MIRALRDRRVLRLIWLGLLAILAACNTGSNSAPY
jgi:hypothetical protein